MSSSCKIHLHVKRTRVRCCSESTNKGSYTSTPHAGPAHLLVLIDGWNALVNVLHEYERGRLRDDLIAPLSEDPSARAQAETLRRIGGYSTRRDAAIGQDAVPFTVL